MKHGGRDQAPETAAPGVTGVSAREQALLEYLRGLQQSLQQILGAQRDVMLSYLGGGGLASPAGDVAELADRRPAPVDVPDVDVPDVAGSHDGADPAAGVHRNGRRANGHSAGPPPAPAAGTVTNPALGGAALPPPPPPPPSPAPTVGPASVVAPDRGERDGDAGPGLDLHDLDPGRRVAREVREVRDVREVHEVGAGTDRPEPEPVEPDEPPPIPPTTRRYVLETAMLAPALPVASAAGKTLALVSDAWDGLDELRGRLERSGASVQVVPTYRAALGTPLPDSVTSLLARVDGVVHLGAADRRVPVDARDVFAMLQPAIDGGASTLVAAVAPLAPAAPAAVSGVPGLMRALARELPDRHIRAVELSPDQPPDVVARLLADEILDPAGPVSVAYRDGTRVTRRVAKGAALSHDTPVLPFDTRSVVVMTGGARGIGAHAAVALARATGCRLELVGRSPVPVEDEDPRTALAGDRAALRRVLTELGGPRRTPTEIDYACERILAAREIRATLQAVRAAGSPVTYHAADVRDRAGVERVLQDVRARHGHIDAIIHGAGVVDERLARDKSADRFHRVFATKVDAARILLSLLQHDVRLVVFFGSTSGVFGTPGQVDLSAATDALDDLANRLDGIGGRRIVSIDWGPWSVATRSTGSGEHGRGPIAPELERELAHRGIGLIDPDEGVRALLAEMATLPGEPSQVVVMRSEPEAFMDRREAATPVALPATVSRQAARHRRSSPDTGDARHLAVDG